MRVILWVTLALGAVWGGYWFVGSSAIERAVAAGFAQSASAGITAAQQGISVAGFPNRFDLTVTAPDVSDPATGWGWQAPFAQILAMTWKPWHVIAVLPHDQQIIAPGQKIALTSAKIEASLRLQPSADLPLDEVIVEGHDLLATSDLGWRIGAKSIVAAIARDLTQTNAQHLGLQASDVAPDPQLAALVPALGPTVSTVFLDATLTLSAPLDRHAGENRPKVTKLHLADFHMTWGELGITASGDVAPGPTGLAEGKVSFRFKNWRTVPALMVALGLIQPGLADSITGGLEAMAKSGADPTVLDLALVFADGWTSFGPLPLGPAPQMN